MHFTLSVLLSFVGLGVAACVLAVNLMLIIYRKAKWQPVPYICVSLFYGYSLTASLIRQSSGLVCALTPERTLLIYGGLLALHLYFLWDSVKPFRSGAAS